MVEAGEWDRAAAKLKAAREKFADDLEIRAFCIQAEEGQRRQQERYDSRLAFLKLAGNRALEQKDYDQVMLLVDADRELFSTDLELQVIHTRSSQEQARIRAELESEFARLSVEVSDLLNAGKYERAKIRLELVEVKFGNRSEYRAMLAGAEDQEQKVRAIIIKEIPQLWTECRLSTLLGVLGGLSATYPETKGLIDAQRQAQEVVGKAEELVAQGGDWMNRRRPKKAIHYFEKARSLCIDFEPALDGIEQANCAIKKTHRRRLFILLFLLVVAMGLFLANLRGQNLEILKGYLPFLKAK